MKIKSIEIKNFRSIQEVIVNCEDFNTFVGPNGAGKSTILNALNIFFGEINSFSESDFYNRDTKNTIEIKITFDDLSDEAKEEFSHYVRNGQLVVKAEVNKTSEMFEKKMHGERYIFPKFKKYFEATGAIDQKLIFGELRKEFSDIENATTKDEREKALNKFEEGLPDNQKELTKSKDNFFGVSKDTDKFQRHICWVYVPAVKDASSESEQAKTSHLGKLIQHTVKSRMNCDHELKTIRENAQKEYTKLLNEQKKYLNDLQTSLATRLRSIVMTDADLKLDWNRDEKFVSVQDPIAQVLLSEREYTDKVEAFGHGLQRSFLLVILQELMAVDVGVAPTLLLGCEEPELYQHPPQAKYLAETLKEVSQGDAQVFITTHSPYFIDVEHFEGIKMLRNDSGSASVFSAKFEDILFQYNKAFSTDLKNTRQAKAKLAISLQSKFNEIFFASRVILVEGISDLAYLEAYLQFSERKSEFRKSGSSIVVCDGKRQLAMILLVAKSFKIPYHVIFDCDSKFKNSCHAQEHIIDNNAIMTIAEYRTLKDFPEDHIFEENLTGWHDDIEQMIEKQFEENADVIKQAGRDAVGNLKCSQKNPLYVVNSMSKAWEKGKCFPILKDVIDRILK